MVNLPLPGRRNTRATDSLRRPVPRNQVCVPAKGVPVEPNVPPNDGWLPRSHLDTTPQGSKFLCRCVRTNLKLHACLFPAKAPLRRNSYVRKKTNLAYSATAWGFCPACRAKPAPSRYTRSFFARRARSLFFGSMPRTASRLIQSDLDSHILFAGTCFNPPGYPLCEK